MGIFLYSCVGRAGASSLDSTTRKRPLFDGRRASESCLWAAGKRNAAPGLQPWVAVLHAHFVRPLSGGASPSIFGRLFVQNMLERTPQEWDRVFPYEENHANQHPWLRRQPQLPRSAVLMVAGGSGSNRQFQAADISAAVGASAHGYSSMRLGVVGRADPASSLDSTTRKRPPVEWRALWFPMVAGAGLEPATFGL